MPLPLQAKVLRAVQEQSFEPVGGTCTVTVDVRFVAATHHDLKGDAARSTFREDLFYRLNVFPIGMPSLRERQGDVTLLARHFLARHAASMGKRINDISPAALDAMEAYDWPGNIRELQNCVERAVIVAQGKLVEAGDLPAYIFNPAETLSDASPADLDGALARIERDFIVAALRATQGVQARAVECLGITECSLWYRLKKLQIRINRDVD